MSKPRLTTGVDSTPRTLCKKQFRQWKRTNIRIILMKNIVTNFYNYINLYVPYSTKKAYFLE